MVGPSSEPSDGRPANSPATPAAAESPTVAATLYVDTENLQNSAQALIERAIESWPERAPPLAQLSLYVQADRVQLWDLWVESRLPNLTVVVHGVQRFSGQPTKNSADIALAIDAVADFMAGATQYVAVMSDDSDFIALYAKLRQLANGNVPFLWVLTDRPGTRSATIRDYFPNDHLHVVCAPVSNSAVPASSDDSEDVEDDHAELFAAMAAAIIQELPVGTVQEHGLSTDHQRTLAGSSDGDDAKRKLWHTVHQQSLALAGRARSEANRH